MFKYFFFNYDFVIFFCKFWEVNFYDFFDKYIFWYVVYVGEFIGFWFDINIW